jgi:hypothetical protein
MLMFTDMGGHVESLLTLGFLSFFFVYLLRIINVIDKPSKVGRERTDDDVSLFLLTEFVVHAHACGTKREVDAADVTADAEALEQRLLQAEEAQAWARFIWLRNPQGARRGQPRALSLSSRTALRASLRRNS